MLQHVQCYNTSEGKPVHTNVDDELQLLPKETNLTPETGIKRIHYPMNPTNLWESRKQYPTRNKPKNLGGIFYFTKNNKEKINKNYVLQESQTNKPNQQQYEERNNQEILTVKWEHSPHERNQKNRGGEQTLHSKMKINGVKEEFIIDTGSLSSTKPPDKRQMKSPEIQKRTTRCQYMNKKEVKCQGNAKERQNTKNGNFRLPKEPTLHLF